MALSQGQVDGIYKHILDSIVAGLDSGELEAYEASEIAEYILNKVEQLYDENSINAFYEQLSDLWPFMGVLMQEKNIQNQEKMEAEASEGALALLQHGKIDEALSIAKTATN